MYNTRIFLFLCSCMRRRLTRQLWKTEINNHNHEDSYLVFPWRCRIWELYRSWWDPLLPPHSVLWLVYTEPGSGHTSGRPGNQCSCRWRNRLYKDLKRKVQLLCFILFLYLLAICYCTIIEGNVHALFNRFYSSGRNKKCHM